MKSLLTLFVLLWSLCAWGALNLNSANQEQLQTLKGIGPVKARAIVEYRRQHGPFKSIEELNNVPGFGEKTVRRLTKELTLSGASSVPPTPAP